MLISIINCQVVMLVFSIAHNVRPPDPILDNHIVTAILSQNKIPRKKIQISSLIYQAPFEFDIWDLELILNLKNFVFIFTIGQVF